MVNRTEVYQILSTVAFKVRSSYVFRFQLVNSKNECSIWLLSKEISGKPSSSPKPGHVWVIGSFLRLICWTCYPGNLGAFFDRFFRPWSGENDQCLQTQDCQRKAGMSTKRRVVHNETARREKHWWHRLPSFVPWWPRVCKTECLLDYSLIYRLNDWIARRWKPARWNAGIWLIILTSRSGRSKRNSFTQILQSGCFMTQSPATKPSLSKKLAKPK